MTYPNTTENQIQHIILQKIQFGISQELSKMDLHFDFKVDMFARHITDSFVYQIKMNILGEKHKERIFHPKSWWEMFKKQCFPNWLLMKFPVKNVELGTLELYQLFPHIKASISEERHYIHFAKYNPMEKPEKRSKRK